MHCSGGGGGCTCPGLYLPKGVPAQGDLPARGVVVYLPRGVVYLPRGVYLPMGVIAHGVVSAKEVYLPGGVPAKGGVPAQGVPARVLLREQNDRQVQNITLPQTSFAGGNYLQFMRESTLVSFRCEEGMRLYCDSCDV